jgi:hypothetical protein
MDHQAMQVVKVILDLQDQRVIVGKRVLQEQMELRVNCVDLLAFKDQRVMLATEVTRENLGLLERLVFVAMMVQPERQDHMELVAQRANKVLKVLKVLLAILARWGPRATRVTLAQQVAMEKQVTKDQMAIKETLETSDTRAQQDLRVCRVILVQSVHRAVLV